MTGFTASLLPPVIGHRGAAGRAPENTLSGFRVARDLGARWVEFDVRLSADGRCVLMHDDEVDRTTDGHGAVADLDLDALSGLDAGIRFDPRFAGEPVPTLEEAIDHLALLGLGANIEIKPQAGTEVETAEAVCDIVTTSWPTTLPPPLLSSFATTALETARRRAPDLSRGLLREGLGTDWREMAVALDVATVNTSHLGLTAARAKEVMLAGYPLLAYTVNEAGRARELFGWGVTAIFSDVPDVVIKGLG